jgi:hypothetical protein
MSAQLITTATAVPVAAAIGVASFSRAQGRA